MLITTNMVSGLRGMLQESQASFAEILGVNRGTIVNIEKGETGISEAFREKLLALCEQKGFEFVDGGVREKPDGVRTLKGTDGFRQMMDMVYKAASEDGGDICIFNGPPSRFIKWLGEDWYTMHKERMEKVKENYNFRIIIREGNENLIASGIATYGEIGEDMFSDATVYIFGEYAAMFNFADDDLVITVNKQRSFADWLRGMFDYFWEERVTPID